MFSSLLHSSIIPVGYSFPLLQASDPSLLRRWSLHHPNLKPKRELLSSARQLVPAPLQIASYCSSQERTYFQVCWQKPFKIFCSYLERLNPTRKVPFESSLQPRNLCPWCKHSYLRLPSFKSFLLALEHNSPLFYRGHPSWWWGRGATLCPRTLQKNNPEQMPPLPQQGSNLKKNFFCIFETVSLLNVQMILKSKKQRLGLQSKLLIDFIYGRWK